MTNKAPLKLQLAKKNIMPCIPIIALIKGKYYIVTKIFFKNLFRSSFIPIAFTLIKTNANVHIHRVHSIDPLLRIFGGIISDTRTKGSVRTPQHPIKMVNEKLAIGIHANGCVP